MHRIIDIFLIATTLKLIKYCIVIVFKFVCIKKIIFVIHELTRVHKNVKAICEPREDD